MTILIAMRPLPTEFEELGRSETAGRARPRYENVRDPDPYAPLWCKITTEPRAWYEMDGIAWEHWL
jgi:hypothetical protein